MNWLQQRREELKLTQEELARELQLAGVDISRSAVGSWESGQRSPQLDKTEFRQALARVLQLSEADLLLRAGFPIITKHSDEAERAAHIVDRLSPEKRELAIRILEALN